MNNEPLGNRAAQEVCSLGRYKEPVSGICTECRDLCRTPATLSQCQDLCPGYVECDPIVSSIGPDTFKNSISKDNVNTLVVASVLCSFLVLSVVLNIVLIIRLLRNRKSMKSLPEKYKDTPNNDAKCFKDGSHQILLDSGNGSMTDLQNKTHTETIVEADYCVEDKRSLLGQSTRLTTHQNLVNSKLPTLLKPSETSATPPHHTTPDIHLVSDDFFSSELVNADQHQGVTLRFTRGIERLRCKRHMVRLGTVVHVTMFDDGIDVFFEPDDEHADLLAVKEQIMELTELKKNEIRIRVDAAPGRRPPDYGTKRLSTSPTPTRGQAREHRPSGEKTSPGKEARPAQQHVTLCHEPVNVHVPAAILVNSEVAHIT